MRETRFGTVLISQSDNRGLGLMADHAGISPEEFLHEGADIGLGLAELAVDSPDHQAILAIEDERHIPASLTLNFKRPAAAASGGNTTHLALTPDFYKKPTLPLSPEAKSKLAIDNALLKGISHIAMLLAVDPNTIITDGLTVRWQLQLAMENERRMWLQNPDGSYSRLSYTRRSER